MRTRFQAVRSHCDQRTRPTARTSPRRNSLRMPLSQPRIPADLPGAAACACDRIAGLSPAGRTCSIRKTRPLPHPSSAPRVLVHKQGSGS
eukprot:754403-Hanusia_phi.AAC.1